MTRSLLSAAVLALVVLASAPAVAAGAGVTRIAGSDRFETAVELSARAYPSGADAVVIATGFAWPDALGGSALAGVLDAPILLVGRDSIPGAVAAEIRRLAPGTVYILGGEGAVGARVAGRLPGLLPVGATITRLAGRDRYETASIVASETIGRAGAAWDGTAFVATGSSFADGLAVSPVAAASSRPLYLIDERVAQRVLDRLASQGASSAVILGGPGAVSDGIGSRVPDALTGGSVTARLAGTDRHATAVEIAEYAVGQLGFSWADVALATSADFADGIAAGPLLAASGMPLLTTHPSGLADGTAAALFYRRGTVTDYTVIGGPRAVPAHVAQEAQFALVARHFDVRRATLHIEELAGLGPRAAGSTAERRGFDYIADRLRSWGYTVSIQEVAIPGGTSRNIIAEKAGATSDVVLLGAHVDSKPPSPGGNDNASGCGAVLELARVLHDVPTVPTVRFVFFGAEEISGPSADDHHFGSRQYVASLSSTQRARIHAMVSVDMVGYGGTFNIRSMGSGPQEAVDSLERWAAHIDQPLPYLRDPGRFGWSDHEGFERVGIPAAWLEWRVDPDYHTTRDTAAHVQPSRVRATGRLLRGWVLGMDAAELGRLR